MTPEQAKLLWCPFGRTVSSRIPASFNRSVRDDVEQPPTLPVCTNCIADGCMMWTGSDCGLKRAG